MYRATIFIETENDKKISLSALIPRENVKSGYRKNLSRLDDLTIKRQV